MTDSAPALSFDYGKAYAELHANGKHFQGLSIAGYAPAIDALVAEHQPARLLDYGCGKGHQYLAARIHESWGGLLPHCYDPGVRGLSVRPEGLFDGILCADVMEHIAEADVPAVLDDIFGLLSPEAGFVFFVIACRPAKKKRLPDGRNVHLTVKAPDWWREQLDAAKERAGADVEVKVEWDEG